jgi:hypothetical protein
MKTTLRVSLGAVVGVLALVGCDAASPPGGALPETVAREVGAPGGTLLQALRDADPYARARTLGALLPTLGPEAIPEVEQALRDPTLDVGATEYELLVRFWASHAPEAATRWVVDRSPLFYRNALVQIALPLWVAADLQASLIAVREWQTFRPDVREASARGLVLGWYAAGLPGLTQYIQDMGVGFEQQLALATYLRAAIPKEGAPAVMRWAESVPEEDPAYKLTVYRQVASALPLFDQAAAMRWCEAQCDGPFGNNLRNILAGRWVLNDGAGALEWLSTAPDGPEKDLAIRASFATWGRADREAALAWMADQTADGKLAAWLKPVLPVYARLLAERSPTEAIEWAQRIEREREREITLIKIARRWRESDETAAEAWLEASPLSEEAREKVRDPDWGPGGRGSSKR